MMQSRQTQNKETSSAIVPGELLKVSDDLTGEIIKDRRNTFSIKLNKNVRSYSAHTLEITENLKNIFNLQEYKATHFIIPKLYFNVTWYGMDTSLNIILANIADTKIYVCKKQPNITPLMLACALRDYHKIITISGWIEMDARKVNNVNLKELDKVKKLFFFEMTKEKLNIFNVISKVCIKPSDLEIYHVLFKKIFNIANRAEKFVNYPDYFLPNFVEYINGLLIRQHLKKPPIEESQPSSVIPSEVKQVSLPIGKETAQPSITPDPSVASYDLPAQLGPLEQFLYIFQQASISPEIASTLLSMPTFSPVPLPPVVSSVPTSLPTSQDSDSSEVQITEVRANNKKRKNDEEQYIYQSLQALSQFSQQVARDFTQNPTKNRKLNHK